MKRSFLEGLFKDLEAEDSVKKSIIDSIMTENGNDLNAEKTKTESLKNDLKVKEGVFTFYCIYIKTELLKELKEPHVKFTFYCIYIKT